MMIIMITTRIINNYIIAIIINNGHDLISTKNAPLQN